MLHPEHKQLLSDVIRFKDRRCLEPTETCARQGIRAHSVPNRAVLSLLEKEGHVIAPAVQVDMDTGPEVIFKLEGRNRATTFTGLCAEHDDSIFAPIEKQATDFQDLWHLFLLSYRAIIRQLHVDIQEALRIQMLQSRLAPPRRKWSLKHLFDRAMAQHQVVLVRDMYRYKKRFDRSYLGEDATDFYFEHLILDHVEPTVAVSSPIAAALPGKRATTTPPLLLSVVPQHTETHVVLAGLNCNRRRQSKLIRFVRDAPRTLTFTRLTQLIVKNCENFVISPRFFAALSEADQSTLRAAFIATMIKPHTALNELPSLFKDLRA